jgi:hypothetical protein
MPSTVIRRFAWRAPSADGPQALDVEFVTGRVYRYLAVPEEEAQAMRAAFSKGVYFNRHIRDHYPHQRLRSWPEEEPGAASA